MKTILLYLVVSLASGQERGPGVIPPGSSDAPARLSAEAAHNLQVWMGFERDRNIMRDLFRRPPDAVVSDLRSAAAYMKAYKESEIRLYRSLGDAVRQDIEKLRDMGKVEWKSFLLERPEGLRRELSMIREQEKRLEEQIKSIPDRNDAATVKYKAGLQIELNSVRERKNTLVNDIVEWEAATTQDPDEARKRAIDSLNQRRGDVQRLEDLARRSQAHLTSVYDYTEKAVLEYAGQLPPSAPSTPAAAQPSDGQSQGYVIKAPLPPAAGQRPTISPEQNIVRLPGPPSSAGAQTTNTQTTSQVTAPKLASDRATRRWSRKVKTGSPQYPILVVFAAGEWGNGAELSGTFQAWFTSTATKPDVEFACQCRVAAQEIYCQGRSEDWIGGAVALRAENLIKDKLPSAFVVTASATPARGGAVRAWTMNELTLTEGNEAIEPRPAPGRPPAKKNR